MASLDLAQEHVHAWGCAARSAPVLEGPGERGDAGNHGEPGMPVSLPRSPCSSPPWSIALSIALVQGWYAKDQAR